MTLKKFLSKYEDLAKELVRCGSCGNSLIHCGKYEIVSLLNGKVESILCETCKKNGRKIELVTTKIIPIEEEDKDKEVKREESKEKEIEKEGVKK